MEFLYQELPGPRKRELTAHLRACPDCQSAVDRWRGTMAGLQQWDLPRVQPATSFAGPVLRWGLAAALVVGLGFAIGRFTAPVPDLAEMRTALAADVARQVRQEIAADLTAAVQSEPAALDTEFRLRLRASLDDWSGRTLARAAGETERLFTDYVTTSKAQRRQDQEVILTLFEEAEQRHQARHLNLRRAVETVAVVAANQFEQTENQIGELASFTQARLLPDDGF